jgi:hypothetical protein
VEHCSSQCSAILAHSHIAAESRTRDLRWRRRYIFLYDFELFYSDLFDECDVRALGECAVSGMSKSHHCADGNNAASNAVDIFSTATGTWTTAALRVARFKFAATSLPNQGLAFFAGGGGASILICF